MDEQSIREAVKSVVIEALAGYQRLRQIGPTGTGIMVSCRLRDGGVEATVHTESDELLATYAIRLNLIG